jgi:CubicO group peptidase (beta-lactamase class C family)
MTAQVNHLSAEAQRRLSAAIEQHLGVTFPALAICVIHAGDVTLDAAWGWIDPETGQHPVTPDTRFDLASLTKLYTTSALLTYISAGAVGLDTPLVELVPEFGGDPRPIDGGQDPFTRLALPTPDDLSGVTVDPARVTLFHLLTHTSGLAPWRAVYQAAGAAPTPPGEADRVGREIRWANAVRALCSDPFVGEPGSSVRYSDLGLMLLGEATARLYGDSLDRAIESRVTRPLDLESVTFNPARRGVPLTQIAPTEIDADWRKRRCWGEVHDENACGVGGIAGHAGLFASAFDVASLGWAWCIGDRRLAIDPDLRALATMQHAETDGARRGLGWALKAVEDSMAGDLFGTRSYGHSGFTGTTLWIDPARRLVVALLTNRVYPGREREGIHAFRRAAHDALASD